MYWNDVARGRIMEPVLVRGGGKVLRVAAAQSELII